MTRFLVASPRPWEHPSYYPVEALVGALRAEGAEVVSVGGLYGRLSRRLGLRLSGSRRLPIVVPLMGPRPQQLAGAALRGRPVVFAWDVWESSIDEWMKLLRDYNVDIVVCTSTAARDLLRNRGFAGEAFFMPEATSVSGYRPGMKLVDRPIRVLELGRRFDAWHEAVQRSGLVSDIESRYEARSGQIVFPTRPALVDGFASSAISVCFPRSMTHPADAGRVETFTHRYLESMASGCLILGHAPGDLIDLFGYNPVIEAEIDSAASQLREVLKNLDAYQDLVDRNLETVRRVGDWAQRARDVARIVREHG